ncbi:hypothetical protein BDZ97DRAFT_1694198 [Flammula alnicola]|nr:hypothetical protein BDZ97DRAFT_1694198 [Flammula alnicola]
MSSTTCTSKQLLGDVAKRAVHSLGKKARTTFPILNDFEGSYVPGSSFAVVRHTRSLVYYQGVSTTVPISILGRTQLPATRCIKLQRRGWRTGMFGWTAGGLMGGKLWKEIDVTPENAESWDTGVDTEWRLKYNRDIEHFLSGPGAPRGQEVQETDLIRIPVSSGDGYFRLVVYPSKSSRSPITSSAVFRVGSLAMRSAHLRGASPLTLAPELVVKHTADTMIHVVQGAVYAAIPVIQTAQNSCGTKKLGNYMLQKGCRCVGTETDLSVDVLRQRAEEKLHHNFRIESVGVRTSRDLKEDKLVGKGGMCYRRS